jgi:hypothetical protein
MSATQRSVVPCRAILHVEFLRIPHTNRYERAPFRQHSGKDLFESIHVEGLNDRDP